MADQPTSPGEATNLPSLSATRGIADVLLKSGCIGMPTRPGLLATIDRFEIVEVIGQGGMGIVLLARDPTAGTLVAIKMLRPELTHDPQQVRRFLLEAKHLRNLEHPGILRMLEVCDRVSGPYFVTPYKERGSLAHLIKPAEPLDFTRSLTIAHDVAEGLAYAHRRGLIHRDVKPHNVLLGADGRACLADFGLVRTVFNDSVIEPGHEGWLGTCAYISPAVARGEAEDTRCDIYAFGALLYEMLTGEPPHSGQSREMIVSAILAGPPRAIFKRNTQAHPGLTAIAEGCMARELRDRYATMEDVVADLDRLVAGKTPLGPRGRTKPWQLRQLAAIGAAALVVMGLTGLTWKLFSISNHGVKPESGRPAPATPGASSLVATQNALVETPTDLQAYIREWPVVFEDPLTKPSCLERAYLSRGMRSGPQPFEVRPSEGLLMRGFFHCAAWWKVALGQRCAMFVEFRPDSAGEHGTRLWLNGPGYGVNGALGYSLWIREDTRHWDIRHNGRVIPLGSVYREPLAPTRWYRLAMVRDGSRISIWLDDEPVMRCTDESEPDTPLSRFAAIGTGSGCYSPKEIGVAFRSLIFRMPAGDSQRLSTGSQERILDPPAGTSEAPDGDVLFKHDFALVGLRGWQVAAGNDGVRLDSRGVVLGGEPRPLLWCQTPNQGDFSAECGLRCAPNDDTAGFYLFLGIRDPITRPGPFYRACVLRCTNHLGENDLWWTTGEVVQEHPNWDDAGPTWTCLARQPLFAMVPDRAYTIRAERRGSHIRAFLNGRLLIEGDLPENLPPDEKIFLGLGNIGGEKTIEWVRLCRLKSASSQPL